MMGYTNLYSEVYGLEHRVKRELKFHFKKDLESTLSEIEKLEGMWLPKKFKETVKIIDDIISKEEDIGVVETCLRSLLTCIMYWSAKKNRSWTEEATKEVEDERLKNCLKFKSLLFSTMDYIRHITYLSDRCIELILGKEG